jgi:hypothetical protein
MISKDDALIRVAMTQRRLIQFSLHGRLRVAEPHGYGVRNGVSQLLVYQVAGDSASGKLPNWRWVVVSQVQALEVLDPMFRGRPHTTPAWDRLFLTVEAES